MLRGSPSLYFKSLNRPFTVLGVDRQLFYLFVGICLPVAFSGHLLPLMDIIAFGLFLILYVFGVLVTRIDSQILAIYRRHIHYRKYYAAISGIHATLPLLRVSVPFYQGKKGWV